MAVEKQVEHAKSNNIQKKIARFQELLSQTGLRSLLLNNIQKKIASRL